MEWVSELGVREALVWVGLIAGLCYGVVAEQSGFCIRRVVSDWADGQGSSSFFSWLAAVAIALPLTQWMFWADILDPAQMVYFPDALSIWTTLIGAGVFGVGMVLTRGCPARLLVLSATGNLRALFGILVVALSAYLVFKGLFAEERVAAQAIGALQFPQVSLFAWFGPTIWFGLTVAVALVALIVAIRNGRRMGVFAGGLIGAIVGLTWWATAVVGGDPFDPVPPASLSFVVPLGDTLVYGMLASGLSASFPVGLVVGVFCGALVSAVISGHFRIQTFASGADHARYTIGAVMMGVGGVFALGCTTGQALVGVSTLSLWSVLVTFVIFISGFLGHRLFMR